MDLIKLGRQVGVVGVVALSVSLFSGSSDAGTPPGTGLVTITSPSGGKVVAPTGSTQVTVHLEVAFGEDVAGAPANPATFKPTLTGISASVLLPLFTDVKDASGNVIGKKADVTVPFKKKYTFKASVFSVIPPGSTKAVKFTAKTSFVPAPPAPPAIQNFRISNPAGTVGGKPVVSTGQSAHFQADLVSTDGEAITSYTLDPGDGSAPITRTSTSGLTASDELVVYSGFGDFTASLKVTNASSLSATQTLALHANVPPTAKIKINPTQATFGYPVTFDAVDSADPDGDALTYAFSFGDGSAPVSGSANSVTHTYPSAGVTKKTYTVTLTVTDAYNASATTRSSLTVTSSLYGKPMLQITSPLSGEMASVTGGVLSVDVALGKASSGADPDPATFKAVLNSVNLTADFTQVKDPKRGNAVVGMHGSIPASKVHVGGGSNSLLCSIRSKAFTTTGGSTRTISTSQTVRFTAVTVVVKPPTASFSATPSQAQVNQTVVFDASASSDPQGKPLTFAWDFGDGSKQAASASAAASHPYSAAGAYTITLTVSNGVLNATATSQISVQAISTGTPVLTVSIPGGSGSALDFGDLSGNMNILEHSIPAGNGYIGQKEYYPAWTEKCVEITNTGTGTLTISSVTSGNGAFQVRNASQVTSVLLGAGESYFVDVRFSPRPYSDPSDKPFWQPVVAPGAASPGPRSDTLTLVTNAGTQTVSLTGNVVTDIPADSIRLMHSDTVRGWGGAPPPDDLVVGDPYAHGGRPGSVVDMGLVATSKSCVFAGFINQGDAAGTVTGVDVLDDGGNVSPDFSAQLVHLEGNFSPESDIAMPSGSSLENLYLAPNFFAAGNGIQVTFHPTNTVVVQQRLSARMVVHTTSGSDLVMGVTGIGIDAPYYTLGGGDFEFNRIAPGSSTTKLYETTDSLATMTVTNIGRKSGTVTATVADINGGSAPAFAVSPASVTLGPGGNGTFSLTFTASAAGAHSGVLKVDPGLPFEPAQFFLLHGYGKGGAGMLGSAANWYTYDGSDFTQTEMIAMDKTGMQSPFSQLDGLKDPFQILGNTVDMGQYSNPDWSSLVMLAGAEYTIDGGVLGPYSLTNTDGSPNTQLTSAAKTRLLSGQPIYSGGIEHSAGFINGIDGHVDIQSDATSNDSAIHNGSDPVRLDVTPDGILFYTSVSSNLSSDPTTVIVTSLKWENLSTHTGGVAVADVAGLLGISNEEVLDMRAIKTAAGYRAFFVFDGTDASNNQVCGDIDLSSAFGVTADKSLTGTLSADTEASVEGNGNQPILIDANGLSYTSATIQNSDGTSTIQILRENLHASTGAGVFGSVTVNFGDSDAGEVMLDNQGNVFLVTDAGICMFNASGAFQGYVLEGQTYYADNFAGGSTNGSNTQNLSDFNAIWMDK